MSVCGDVKYISYYVSSITATTVRISSSKLRCLNLLGERESRLRAGQAFDHLEKPREAVKFRFHRHSQQRCQEIQRRLLSMPVNTPPNITITSMIALSRYVATSRISVAPIPHPACSALILSNDL